MPYVKGETKGTLNLNLLDSIGEGPFAIVQLVAHLIFGWPAYLLTARGVFRGCSRGCSRISKGIGGSSIPYSPQGRLRRRRLLRSRLFLFFFYPAPPMSEPRESRT